MIFAIRFWFMLACAALIALTVMMTDPVVKETAVHQTPSESITVTWEPTPTPTPPPPPTLVAFTPTPEPTPIPVGVAGCPLVPPAHLDHVETAFWVAFEDRFCQGDEAVKVIRCEGWNSTANWDIAHRSPSGDVGPAQINQVHDDGPGYALRVLFGDHTRWPGPAATLEGNIEVALYLRDLSGNWDDWYKSYHCHGLS